ncbi:hypothetical protein ACFO3J_05145 [Streptomyces polygonati]|uniref:Uncharacterized protein n=1 Tax=Streptomyces polygonati TaxID=1617087 RepID=A0ABV8HKS4_9ACTN
MKSFFRPGRPTPAKFATVFFFVLFIAVSLYNVADTIHGSRNRWAVGLACFNAFVVGWLLKTVSRDEDDAEDDDRAEAEDELPG